ncbi:hypothetical protein Pmar_PMAR021501 [Perkinsus marinus ATCC 50983]|uniref:Uncharacterized protein n=1 Tax=Perkinsus marinus (strain ATCC 50983 / TXsc) TaxID=423536 RepID=C5KZK1_PERM5|nr:hypothetical protein Pmar_PMAR021501 [Perkinsus marinus ATCC 50983]EER10092.1 hypothetical protein Pmar_PMAR021501 [Perkinsus marinus ATCC 50983]|eukprot:XP_002778297.1 hypothetical protein Pmar_PMAR021501 [Perkinsus marinus ATCC 50983]
MNNFWKAGHFRPSTHNEGVVAVEAFAVQSSWTVVPQLENCTLELIGEMRAATRMSTIEISFTAVSDADKLVMTALKPTGFDFTATIALSDGHEILDAGGSTLSLRVVTRAGERNTVRLGEVSAQ